MGTCGEIISMDASKGKFTVGGRRLELRGKKKGGKRPPSAPHPLERTLEDRTFGRHDHLGTRAALQRRRRGLRHETPVKKRP